MYNHYSGLTQAHGAQPAHIAGVGRRCEPLQGPSGRAGNLSQPVQEPRNPTAFQPGGAGGKIRADAEGLRVFHGALQGELQPWPTSRRPPATNPDMPEQATAATAPADSWRHPIGPGEGGKTFGDCRPQGFHAPPAARGGEAQLDQLDALGTAATHAIGPEARRHVIQIQGKALPVAQVVIDGAMKRANAHCWALQGDQAAWRRCRCSGGRRVANRRGRVFRVSFGQQCAPPAVLPQQGARQKGLWPGGVKELLH